MIPLLGLTFWMLAYAEPTIFVSPDGRDSAQGDFQHPVASLERARDLVRKLPRSSTIHVVLRGGTYLRDKALSLNEADSGVADAPISWEAYPGERPTISGGVVLSHWSTKRINGVSVWSQKLPRVASGNWYFRSLYGADDHRRQRVRAPRSGFYLVDQVEQRGDSDKDWLNGRDQFYARPGDFPQNASVNSAEVVLMTQWCDNHLPVTAVSPTNLVTSSRFTIQNFAKGDRYWIENARWALSQPGDWALDATSGEILYVPFANENPKQTKLIAPYASQLLALDHVHNVEFKQIQFQHAEWWFPSGYQGAGEHSSQLWSMQQASSDAGGAIAGDSVSDLVFDRCTFKHVGAYAIRMSGPSRHVQVTHSEFSDLGAGAISIGDFAGKLNAQDQDVSREHVIADNYIRAGGRIFPGAVAILGGQIRRTQIVHNEISDFFYTGISCGWTWGFDEASMSRDNVIAFNKIFNIGQNVLGDGGCIYTLGMQPGTVIDSNVVFQSNGTHASRGIYLDDGSSGITVKNNLSFDNRTANFFLWRSKGVQVYNNVFAGAQGSQIELAGAIFNGGAPALDFERNILMVTGSSSIINNFDPKAVQSIYAFKNNLVWSDSGQSVVPSNWAYVGWTAGLVQQDPLFVNAKMHDFRLKSTSPAFTLIGFKRVNWNEAGPRDSTPKLR